MERKFAIEKSTWIKISVLQVAEAEYDVSNQFLDVRVTA